MCTGRASQDHFPCPPEPENPARPAGDTPRDLSAASGVTGVPYCRRLRYTVPYLAALTGVSVLVYPVPDSALVLRPSKQG